MKYLYLILLFYLLIPSFVFAQDHKEAFSDFKETHEKGYNAFVDQIDQDFADFLRNNWVEFQVHSGKVIEEKPKPKAFPQIRNIPIESNELELSKMSPVKLKEALVMPVNYKESNYEGDPKSSIFEFFGEKASVKYVPNFKMKLADEINPEAIGNFWQNVSALDYRITLNDLFSYKEKFSLNDYGYYLLIKKFSESLTANNNQAVLTSWFLLAKSKFKAKIGYNSNEIFMLLPSDIQLYQTSYFDFDGMTYYVMDYTCNKLLTYNENYNLAYKQIDFTITKELTLKEELGVKHVEHTFRDKQYSFDFIYNLNAIKFYQEYPQIDLNGYFNSLLTKNTAQSIISKLQPIVDKMEEVEAVSFLLSLVQHGFGYRIDQDQFGREKAFFPEEILHYPFSDCEDRSVFFAYLVSTLLGNEVVGLDYPEHVATGVHFTTDVPGDFYMFNNKKYTVCDPTYISAPVGVSMNELSASKADLILKKENVQVPENLIVRLKALLGIEGSIEQTRVIEVESGKIVAANYSGNIYIQNKDSVSNEKSSFVAMFDQTNQLKWMKANPKDSRLVDFTHEKNKTYILSEVLSDQKSNNVLAKINADGHTSWETQIMETSSAYPNSNTQVSLYNMSGERIAGKSYSESNFFEGKKLNIRNNRLLVTLPKQ